MRLMHCRQRAKTACVAESERLEVTPIFTKFQVVDFSGSDDFV
jgi:hypothetical protein